MDREGEVQRLEERITELETLIARRARDTDPETEQILSLPEEVLKLGRALLAHLRRSTD